MEPKKERFGIIETTGAGLAVAGYAISPLPRIIQGICETIPASVNIAENLVAVIEMPKKEIESKKIEETNKSKNTASEKTEQPLSIEKKQEEIDAYNPTRTELLKQALDDSQRQLNPYNSGLPYSNQLIDKPIDLRSRIMQGSKSLIGKIIGSERMQKDAEAQINPHYKKNYDAREEIESSAYKELRNSNKELLKKDTSEETKALVERKREVRELITKSQNLTTEQILQGTENQEYSAVIQRADELGIRAPNYEMYGYGGVFLGGIIAAYIGARATKTLQKTVNTGTYVIEKTANGIIELYGLGRFITRKALNMRRTIPKKSNLNERLEDLDTFEITVIGGLEPKLKNGTK